MAMNRGSWLALLRDNLLVAGVYWALGYAVAVFFKAYGLFPAPIWPSASVALVAALVGGRRLWAGIFAGAFLANFTLFGAPVVVALAIGVTNTVAPALGAALIRRFCGSARPFFRFYHVVVFTLFGAGLHGIVAATGGVAASYLGGVQPLAEVGSAWWRWSLADAGGALFFGPALLLWWFDRSVRLAPAGLVELGGLSVVSLAVTAATFFLIDATHHSLEGLPYLLGAPLLWVTVRFSPRAGTTLFSAIAVVATVGTVAGLGPFNLTGADRPLVTLGLMMVSLSVAVLSIGALTAERRSATRALERSNRALERRVAARTAELERALQAKDEFLSTISHEMRTPLTALLGSARLLLDEPLDPPQRELTERMNEAGEVLLALINDVLDISRIEAGRLVLQSAPLSVRALVQRTVRLFENEAAAKGLGLDLQVMGVAETLWGDATRLQQVMMNLVGNAIKYTERGQIHVKVAPVDGGGSPRLCFSVEDTGIGVSETERSQLFEPFSQVDSSAARRYGGSGLGLAISKRLVEAMGGQIGVESTPGQGSCFWFTVPLRDDGPEVPVRGGGLHPPSLSMLLVEDVRESARVLTALLQRDGHAVFWVQDGESALRAAAERAFDLVLMDLQMPGMDGFETTLRLRAAADPAVASLPVFALTANVSRGTLERCLQAGMDDVLDKPLRLEQLNGKLVARFGAVAGEAPPDPESDPKGWLDTGTLRQYRASLGAAEWVDVLALFRSTSRERAQRIGADLEAAALPGVARVAHQLAGAAYTLGVRGIGVVARRLERAAAAGDLRGSKRLFDTLSERLPIALEALERWESRAGGTH